MHLARVALATVFNEYLRNYHAYQASKYFNARLHKYLSNCDLRFLSVVHNFKINDGDPCIMIFFRSVTGKSYLYEIVHGQLNVLLLKYISSAMSVETVQSIGSEPHSVELFNY